MIDVRKTNVFAQWLDGLRDIHARARIQARIRTVSSRESWRCQTGRPGCFGIAHHYGPYRVYYMQKGFVSIILLAGGDKSTQARDIETALRLARNL